MSDAVSARPITSVRYAAASAGENRRSAARTSTRSPRTRSRASGSAGSARVARTRCAFGGRWSTRNSIPPRTCGASIAWTSSSTSTMSSGTALRSLSRGARTASIEGAADSSAARARSPIPGATPRSAAITCAQNGATWLSPPSRESHAVRCRRSVADDSHSASAVVLPNPAGADTSVSFVATPRSSRSVKRGRWTMPPRGLGAYSFVWSRPSGIAGPLYSRPEVATEARSGRSAVRGSSFVRRRGAPSRRPARPGRRTPGRRRPSPGPEPGCRSRP